MEKLGKNARQAAVLVGDPQCAGWPCWGRRIVILRVVRWWRPWTRRLWWRWRPRRCRTAVAVDVLGVAFVTAYDVYRGAGGEPGPRRSRCGCL